MNKKKVLVIAEDNEINRQVARDILKDDYQIIEAKNGIETIKILETVRVDLLLLDIMMPEMDGYETIKEIRSREEFNNLGIVVLSSVDNEHEKRILDLGANEFINKPIDPVVLKNRLHNVEVLTHAYKGKNYNPITVSKDLQAINDSLNSLSKDIEQINQPDLANAMQEELENISNKLKLIFK